MADRHADGAKVRILKGKYLGRVAVVDRSRLTYYVLLEDGTPAGPYLETSVEAYVPPAPPPAAGTLLADYSANKGMAVWPTVQFGGSFGNTKLEVIDSPVGLGKAYQATVNQIGGSPRAEGADWRDTSLAREGTEWFIADTLFFPTSQSWGSGSHHVVIQIGHPGQKAPQQLIEVTGDGDLIVRNGHVTGKADPLLVPRTELMGRAIPLTVRVKFSQDPAKGELEAWVGDKLVVPTMRYATLGASGTGYMKQGQYGDSNGNRVVFHGLKRGTSRGAVAG